MKKLFLVSLCAAIMLSGCAGHSENKSTEASPTTAEVTVTAAVRPDETQLPAQSDPTLPDDGRGAAYFEALMRLHDDHITPAGWEIPDEAICGSIENNRFALTDLTGDGRNELVIRMTETYIAGMVESVFCYDSESGELTEVSAVFPGATYYTCGAMTSPWSHSQGLCGENFWPYDLYRFDAASGQYVFLASVDAWEKDMFPEDFSGNPYPAEQDTDGAGILYYVREGDHEEVMSQSAYENWHSGMMTGKEIPVEFKPLKISEISAVAEGSGGEISDHTDVNLRFATGKIKQRGESRDTYAVITEESIIFFADSTQTNILGYADLPADLRGKLGDAQTELDLIDLDGNGWDDIQLTLFWPDGRDASILWLWNEFDGYAYNEEMSTLPGEPAPRGEG